MKGHYDHYFKNFDLNNSFSNKSNSDNLSLKIRILKLVPSASGSMGQTQSPLIILLIYLTLIFLLNI